MSTTLIYGRTPLFKGELERQSASMLGALSSIPRDSLVKLTDQANNSRVVQFNEARQILVEIQEMKRIRTLTQGGIVLVVTEFIPSSPPSIQY